MDQVLPKFLLKMTFCKDCLTEYTHQKSLTIQNLKNYKLNLKPQIATIPLNTTTDCSYVNILFKYCTPLNSIDWSCIDEKLLFSITQAIRLLVLLSQILEIELLLPMEVGSGVTPPRVFIYLFSVSDSLQFIKAFAALNFNISFVCFSLGIKISLNETLNTVANLEEIIKFMGIKKNEMKSKIFEIDFCDVIDFHVESLVVAKRWVMVLPSHSRDSIHSIGWEFI